MIQENTAVSQDDDLEHLSLESGAVPPDKKEEPKNSYIARTHPNSWIPGLLLEDRGHHENFLTLV